MRNRTIPFFPKRPTPHEIAQYSAIIITGMLLLSLILIKIAFVPSLSFILILLLVVVHYLVALYLFMAVLETFIYRRVKLIYKNIHRLKASKNRRLDELSLNTRIIDQVEREVIDWTAMQQKEIDELKKMEIYRRDFIGNVSHELKTPIFSMQGYLDTLLEGGIYDEAININYLQRAVYNLDRLRNIVLDLDMITKLETNVIQLNLERFDINDLTKEVCAELERRGKEKKIKLKVKSEIPVFVLADRSRIHQVLINLIVNSIKNGTENGRTLINFFEMDEETILVEVSDNGVGISEEHITRLFERFYRVDKSRSRNDGGTGLGLAIVKHLVEAHHQTINVRSAEGVGSTFGFTLKKA